MSAHRPRLRVVPPPNSNLLSPDELARENARFDYLMSWFLGHYSREQRSQINALLVSWAHEVTATGQARPHPGYRRVLRQ